MTTDFALYIAGLPKVLAGAATMCRDAEGRILIVKPNYRDDGTWNLPGGTIESDQDETPRQGARRETLEEVGLDVVPGPLLVVDWSSAPGRPPLVSYLYDGGVLPPEQLAAIRLQEEELDSWRLMDPADTDRHFSPRQAGRIHAALAALAAGTGPAELVNGRPVTAE
jgi:8-oxo-dGTP pyrophosphatase MutT (NUDIX family)